MLELEDYFSDRIENRISLVSAEFRNSTLSYLGKHVREGAPSQYLVRWRVVRCETITQLRIFSQAVHLQFNITYIYTE